MSYNYMIIFTTIKNLTHNNLNDCTEYNCAYIYIYFLIHFVLYYHYYKHQKKLSNNYYYYNYWGLLLAKVSNFEMILVMMRLEFMPISFNMLRTSSLSSYNSRSPSTPCCSNGFRCLPRLFCERATTNLDVVNFTPVPSTNRLKPTKIFSLSKALSTPNSERSSSFALISTSPLISFS